MFSNTEDLLPVISFNAKTSSVDQKKHDDFVARMMEKGTPKNKSAYCLSGTCAYVNPHSVCRVMVGGSETTATYDVTYPTESLFFCRFSSTNSIRV